MDKTAIKNFAISARVNLKAAIAQKAFDIGVFEDRAAPVSEVQGGFLYNERSYSKEELAGRKKLIDTIGQRADGKGYQHGYTEVMEEAAYTWFNRLIALRFMELNGYLPSGIRILSSTNPNRLEPDCIRAAESLDFVDIGAISALSNATEKLYRYILIAQCNALADTMPGMFERISDYTELLLPDRLYLLEGNIVYDLVHSIKETDFTEQVEIIGWLYQFYISEKKDEVFAGLKKNIKITKENIPAATQLFTPDWIVKYMVENSIGRLAVEKLGIKPADMKWDFYLPEAEQTAEVLEQLTVINRDKNDFGIKNVKVIDPCMGSGHILVYAFDVLYQIYEKLGFNIREIPNLILENNLFGLDIDERAGQLSYFALMMKARSYNRRFFRQDIIPQPKVYAIPDYEDWKEYGSIVKLEKPIDRPKIGQISLDDKYASCAMEAAIVSELLCQKYDVVVTNPPYMGSSGMSANLSEFAKKEYPDSKSDLFAVFIEKCGEMLKPNGFQAMITQHAWMFLSSYEKLRVKLMGRDMINMAHLGARAFEEIGGEVVQTTAFVMRNSNVAGYLASYVRLVDYNSQQAKETAFLSGGNRHTAQKENFEKIPGMPVAYWVSLSGINNYLKIPLLSKSATTKQGFKTGNNDLFLRFWFEVHVAKISFEGYCKKKWFPCNKGGSYRKWFGNQEYVVNWENDGYAICNYRDTNGKLLSRPQNLGCNFHEGLTWSSISSGSLSLRYSSQEMMFESKGSGCFIQKNHNIFCVQAFLNSVVGMYYITALAPTLDYSEGSLLKLPYEMEHDNTICQITKENILFCRTDWDSFETSWNFKTHPLIAFKGNYEEADPLLYADDLAGGSTITKWSKTAAPISQAYDAWERFTDQQFSQLKTNEEDLNRIFIEIYGLQDELTPEVADKDVTIRKADLVRDIKSFISYAVGCIFGRYSLDVEGLAYAGGAWENEKYKTFVPDKDNILPITDNEYFDDDLVTRFFKFVEVVYGEQTLGENLDFIAAALYPNANGTAREKIRRYFVNDFYKDHVKVYQKKPIYWQFDSAGSPGSGKQNGFKALIYLHHYDKYTVARVRTDYLHPLQRKYEAEIKRLEMLSGMTENPREKAEHKKQIEKIEKQLTECRAYDPALAHIAHQAIELDLDDGVTVNYGKFMGIDAGGDKAVDLLTKI